MGYQATREKAMKSFKHKPIILDGVRANKRGVLVGRSSYHGISRGYIKLTTK
jgi:hypothetical protein